MGNCSSCYSGSNATNAPKVKIVLLDGQLREFSSPMKVFLVAPPLNYLTNDVCSFICNADEMDFDNYVTAMSGEEELRPGQLYFELPASWLNRRLTTEDMASMAVKAGKALMISSKVRCGCWVKRVDPLVFCDVDDDDEMTSSTWSTVGGGGGGGENIGNHRGSGGKWRIFTRLERIAE
ncbi:hypothetical protein L1987_78551 [Smallanthus sonchifolius]|uniref:Uncharacterized protein n=1 Tax=Smallanthus sonchifolius TaxID=185202 RepID=A0ACB8ZCZ5_9ASTR|nr:hypothetical protein L1987_78551 [Smallanthus sonchifolius]